MAFGKMAYLLVIFMCWWSAVSSALGAELTSLYQSVERALEYSPQLQAAAYYYEGIEH